MMSDSKSGSGNGPAAPAGGPGDLAWSVQQGSGETGAAGSRFFGRPRRVFILSLAGAALLIALVYFAAAGMAAREIEVHGQRQLRIVSLDLESVLNKFETLPYTLAFHPDAAYALLHPGERAVTERLNTTFQTIQSHARVAVIYMMDSRGNTIASSNWNQPISFVGRNFAFRPYFRDAIEGRAGRFYGIGSATGEPGYFIAQPIYAFGETGDGSRPLGVMAVKIDLAEFEQTWRSSEDPIALADSAGIVFLSNRPSWKFRSMRPLDKTTQEALADTLQYAGRAITPIRDLPADQRRGFGAFVSQPVGQIGWRLLLFPDQARIMRSAALWAMTAALLLAVAGASAWALHQHRRRLEERSLSRRALQRAAEELETRIAQRTEDLLQANRHLEQQYARLKDTEHLLRSTQNELVQAGKLTMLGQMAAGVTHELNQPLAAIRAFADNAVTLLAQGNTPRAQENLAHISAASARMGAIISQLKGFARNRHEAVSVVDLARSIEASAILVRSDFERHDAWLEIDIRTPVKVTGDAVRTEQVLINLMRNALDAVESAPVRNVSVVLERDGEHALIRVADSGPGIPEDVALHLFEPFFTTKPSAKGLGLGLAICSSIVQAMNGELLASNRPQGGAEFSVRLPLAKDAGD